MTVPTAVLELEVLDAIATGANTAAAIADQLDGEAYRVEQLLQHMVDERLIERRGVTYRRPDPWPIGEEFGLWPTLRDDEHVDECTVTHHRRRRVTRLDVGAIASSCRLDASRADLLLCNASAIERRMAIDHGHEEPIWSAKPGRWYG